MLNVEQGTSGLSDKLEDRRVERILNKKRGHGETFSETFTRKFGAHVLDKSPAGKELKFNNFSQGVINRDLAKKLAKLKIKAASLGEQNMTYQDSKKVKIHKKKHPEVRKASLASEFAHDDIEGVLRGIHSSPLPPNKREHQSSFLSSTGDYIGGGEDHTETIKSIFKDKEFTPEDKGNDGPVTRFSIEHKLPRVQRRMTRRGGRVSFGIHSPVNTTLFFFNASAEQNTVKVNARCGKSRRGIGICCWP